MDKTFRRTMTALTTAYLDIFRLVWPIALGMVNNALLQFTDRAFLAHDSLTELEAVVPASVLAMIALGFFQSVVAYSGTFVAQFHGAGDRRGEVASYHAGVWLSLLSGAAMLLMVPVGGWVFDAFSSGAEIISMQKTYYGICAAGGVFLFGQMAAQSYFTGVGRTRIIFFVNVVGNLANVLLDWLLIFGRWGCPRLGIAGAAYATVAATMLQWLMLSAFLHLDRSAVKAPCALNREMRALVRRILRFGVPAGGYSVMNMLSFTIFIFVTARVGHLEAAVSNACFSICYLMFAPMEGFALGAQALVGQAQGAGDSRRAALDGVRTLRLGCALVAVAAVVMVVFHRQLLASFIAPGSTDAEAFLSLGFKLCLVMAFWQVFDAGEVILSGALKGAGDTRFVFWWMLVSSFGFWMPIVFAVAAVHNTMTALWLTNLTFIVVNFVGTYLRWRWGRWRKIHLVSISL